MKRYHVELKFSVVQEDMFREDEPAQLTRPEQILGYMEGAFRERPEQEQFWVLLLNRKNVCLGRHLVTLGIATAALAHPREVFRAAILGAATSVICVHNHPSGDPAPSSADQQITRQLKAAGETVGIQLLDHVIIGERVSDPLSRGYYSFREGGLL